MIPRFDLRNQNLQPWKPKIMYCVWCNLLLFFAQRKVLIDNFYVSRIVSEIMSASQKHNVVGDELSTLVWSSYYLMYTTYNFLLHIYVVFRILWIAYHADIWVYPILKVLDNQYRLGFFAACWLCLALMYLLGDLLNNTFWSKYFTEWIPYF